MLSPERLKEIREWNRKMLYTDCEAVNELLAEIDRLRQELLEASAYIEERELVHKRELDLMRQGYTNQGQCEYRDPVLLRRCVLGKGHTESHRVDAPESIL